MKQSNNFGSLIGSGCPGEGLPQLAWCTGVRSILTSPALTAESTISTTQHSVMSNRLDSLNSKKPGGKPQLKFKPKAVARRSKEELEKSAPAVKTEEKPNHPPSTRGRGGARGGRGRGRGAAYAGTHVVSSGPLSSSSVGMGSISNSKTGLTNDKVFNINGTAAADPLSNLKLKSRSEKLGTPEDNDSDSEGGGLPQINMSKEYQFDDSETALFPVRPVKDANLDIFNGATPSPTPLAAASRAGTVEPVKSETPDVKSETGSAGPPSSAVAAPVDPVAADEHNRLVDDQQAIVDLITGRFASLKADEPKSSEPNLDYFLIRLPHISTTEEPLLHPDSATDKKVKDEDGGKTSKQPKPPAQTELAAPSLAHFQGHVGQLNFHRSGKITMSLGENTTLDVVQGAPTSFLQELYLVDSHAARKSPDDEDLNMVDEEGDRIVGDIYRLGEVTAKLVATPDIS